jgi:hypothetical protein
MVVLAAPTMAGPSTPSAVNGTYTILIRGYYTSDSAANGLPALAFVAGDQVTISAPNVKADSGLRGAFTATCSLTGDHFSGVASLAGGPPMKIQGRVEAADPTNKNNNQQPAAPDAIVIDARINAFFIDNNGHGGRISGKLNSTPSTQPGH